MLKELETNIEVITKQKNENLELENFYSLSI